MICLALNTGDHSRNCELWCLVLSVELFGYIQRSQLHHVLTANDNDISILLHKYQYQLSEFKFPMRMAIMVTFREKQPRLAVWFEKGHIANSANSWSYDGSIPQ